MARVAKTSGAIIRATRDLKAAVEALKNLETTGPAGLHVGPLADELAKAMQPSLDKLRILAVSLWESGQ